VMCRDHPRPRCPDVFAGGEVVRHGPLNCPHGEKEKRRKGGTSSGGSPFLVFSLSPCGQFFVDAARTES
jgi:hypothetical protein